MAELKETCVERIQGDDHCCVYTAEIKYIHQLNELANLYPNEVNIRYVNEDGSILANVPYDWFKFVKPPTKRNYTQEQREAMAQRMKKARENK